MPGIQMRLDPSDARFFSPDRDLAWCTPHLVARALAGLDPGRQEPWVSDFLRSQNVGDESLCDGARMLAEFMNTAVFDPKYKQPFEAFEAVGFFNLPAATQVIVLAKVGQVFMSAFFPSIRDVTKDPSSPPYKTDDFAKFVEQFQTEATRYRGMSSWRRKLFKWFRKVRARLGI